MNRPTPTPAPPTANTMLSDRDRKYLGAVREHLNLRGVETDRVGAHLEEMAAHLVDAGTDPVAEFGPPGDYAEGIANAEGAPTWVLWARPIGAYLSMVALMTGIVWIGHGTAPGEIPLSEFDMVLPLGMIGLVATLMPSARMRDRIRGLDGPERPGLSIGSTFIFIWLAMMAAALAIALLAAALVDGSQMVGAARFPAWTIGVLCLVIAMIFGWRSIIKPGRRTRFPEGSPITSSRWRRSVKID